MWKNLIINSYFQTEIIYIGLLLLFATILTSIILILANIFGPSTPDVEKVAAYECGFDPYEDARHAFDVHFYLVSMLFIVFDLEAAFFYP
jgi:NADH-quinone oxidoreductase subunit A